MQNVDEIEAFDRQVVAEIEAGQRRIEEEGRAASHVIRDVRTHRVLMPWTGTKRWDGSAEAFSFAEFETNKGMVGVCEGPIYDLDTLREKTICAR